MHFNTHKTIRYLAFLIIYPIILGLVVFFSLVIYSKYTDTNFDITLNQTSSQGEYNYCYTINKNSKYYKLFCERIKDNLIIKIYDDN